MCFETSEKRDKIGSSFLFVVWQTDDWSSLRKNKFHPSNVRNEVGFCDSWSLGGYLSASFMIIPAGKGQSSGETNIDLLDGIFVL